MGSPFMVALQLFISWAVLDAYAIVIPKVPQLSFILSTQYFLGLPLHRIHAVLQAVLPSGIIHSHNMAQASQAPLPYPVVYFLL